MVMKGCKSLVSQFTPQSPEGKKLSNHLLVRRGLIKLYSPGILVFVIITEEEGHDWLALMW